MSIEKPRSRREFVKLTALGAAGAAIAVACGPAPTPTATPAPKPTEAPKPAATTTPAASPTTGAKPGAAASPTTAAKPAAASPTAATKPTEAAKPAATSAAEPKAASLPVPTFPVKLGLISPLTGDVKTYGESVKNAFDLAVDEANAAGAKITVAVVDDKNDPTESANATAKLINQDKVDAIIGSVTSRTTIPDSDIANSNKVVMLSPTATSAKVTVADGKRKEYIFHSCFIDDFQATAMAKFARENLKSAKAAVLYDNSNDYSKGLAEVFKADFTKSGGQVVSFESYGKDDVDFSALVTKAASTNPDFLYLPDYYAKVSLIAQQAREKGLKVTMGGADGWDSPELDVKATEGGYFTNHYSPDDTRPEVQEWVKKYKAKYNADPDALATLTYDGTRILITAIAQANSKDSAKVKDALSNLKDFKGVTGAISFDKNGHPVKAAAMIQISGGKQKFVTMVNP